ncbi:serine hydroxymethyltransferase [Jannaschia sp. W003]|uniref:serine hydroxymethyltransferase n=1 Tax=Jannaschia sp. W003 TaxID=2867012 RepID=UPI0021A4CAEC|nr:serine hydroxymethyltransferase [Jannaschia sp. W003]UWQ21032.1 serine hydroxymethyltransferase [Jannaschia sp. W003]
MNAPHRDAGFFTRGLAETDPKIARATEQELGRQRDEIELIASENIVSRAVMEAQGGVMTNKYAEGYPGRRYYGGCQYVDVAEELAIARARELFGCGFANVQPNSGSQANQGVFTALLKPGDTILGMSLDAGGHLTHGARPNQSGKWFNAVQYGVRREDMRLDYEQVQALATEHQPKMIIAGGSAIPRIIDFARMREIADSVGAWLLVDMAHFAGLVASGHYPSPFPHAHVATTTTHKTLRGPRGGMILTDDEAVAKKVNSAIFPGIQGGPLMHVIAAKAVAFGEALQPGFRDYQGLVVANAVALAEGLMAGGLDIVTGGTDTHLMLVDLRPKGVKGNETEAALGRAHITCNKNGIPFDDEKPTVTSGVRLGTPAGTTRGFGEDEFRTVAALICEVVDGLAANGAEGNAEVEASVRAKVAELTARFPIYPDL